MPTRNVVPNNANEGLIGTPQLPWAGANFNSLNLADRGLLAVTFNPTGHLSFPQVERNYLVTLSWDSVRGFLPVGPFAQKVSNVGNTYWEKEDSQTDSFRISWEVYIPSQVSINGYNPLIISPQVVSFGFWSDPQNLSPACSWLTPTLIP